jgi:hypothetical protein
MLHPGESGLSVREKMVEGAACGAGRGEEPGIHSPWPKGGPNTVPTSHGAASARTIPPDGTRKKAKPRSPQDRRKVAHANPFRPETFRNAGRPSGEVSLDPAIETDQKRNARATLPGTVAILVGAAGAYPDELRRGTLHPDAEGIVRPSSSTVNHFFPPACPDSSVSGVSSAHRVVASPPRSTARGPSASCIITLRRSREVFRASIAPPW